MNSNSFKNIIRCIQKAFNILNRKPKYSKINPKYLKKYSVY